MTAWLHSRQLSTYMLFVALVAIALVASPSITSYIIVSFVGVWLFVTRELARLEGRQRFTMMRLGMAAAVVAAIVVIAAGVKWVGI